MGKAGLKIEHKYRSYGASDPFFLLVAEERKSHSLTLVEKGYRALHIAFVGLPLVAGVDKFVSVLTNWSGYVAPSLASLLGVPPQILAYGAGVLEIFLGIGILMRPRIFADAFSLWVIAITVNLLVQGEHFDIALFNFALAAGSCSLARLSKAQELDDSYDSLGQGDRPAA